MWIEPRGAAWQPNQLQRFFNPRGQLTTGRIMGLERFCQNGANAQARVERNCTGPGTPPGRGSENA